MIWWWTEQSASRAAAAVNLLLPHFYMDYYHDDGKSSHILLVFCSRVFSGTHHSKWNMSTAVAAVLAAWSFSIISTDALLFCSTQCSGKCVCDSSQSGSQLHAGDEADQPSPSFSLTASWSPQFIHGGTVNMHGHGRFSSHLISMHRRTDR